MNIHPFLHSLLALANGPREINRLRTLILQLGFQGRLGSTRSDSWKRTTIGAIVDEIVPGFACSKKNEEPDGHVHLRTHNVGKNGRLNFDLLVKVAPTKIEPEKAKIRAGDVIFNNTNSQELVGKTCLVDRDYPYAFSNHLTVLRFNGQVAPAFVVRYFNLLLREGVFARICNRWIGQAGINTKALRQIEIGLPSVEEQNAIVEKIDALLVFSDELESRQQRRHEVRSRLNDAALDRLTTASDPAEFAAAWQRVRDNFDLLYAVPENVAKLRQAILQLAVQGKLARNDEPVAVVSVEELAGRANMKNGLSLRQSVNSPIRCLAISAMRNGVVKCSVGKPVPLNKREAEPYFVRQGDVFIVRGNGSKDLVGRAGLVQEEIDGVIFPDLFIRVPLDPNRIDAEYFVVAWNSPLIRRQIESVARTTSGIWKVNQGHIASISIPLPSMRVQNKIVARTRALTALCDDLEAKLTQQRDQADRLAEAVVNAVVNGKTWGGRPD